MQAFYTGTNATSAEKPQNGIQGLKHWRKDLLAGLIVSLVSVPLSLGIAVASGAPPICGLISAIIAGLIFPFLGGAFVTISGPAAGLAPVILVAITTLGNKDPIVGYHLTLAVIFFAGILQLILSYFKVAKFSAAFPTAAIEGMLAAVGLLIIGKQIPNFIGHSFKAHDFFNVVLETPYELGHMNAAVFLIASISLVMLFAIPKLKIPVLKKIPVALLVVIMSIAIGQMLHIDKKFLIQIPANPIHGIVFPDFAGLFSSHGPSVWTVLTLVVTLTLVDGFESLATIMAIDRIDPFRRQSLPNRTLAAMGASNILSSLFGGLTIIPGGIKSTTCILSGGRTLWANFYNACFLIAYLFLFRDQINMIPIGALAAVLISIGYKLAAPHKWLYMWKVGPEQLLIFASTVVMTLCTDLLWGVVFGVALKFLITFFYMMLNAAHSHEPITPHVIAEQFKLLFKNPVAFHEESEEGHVVEFKGPLVCFNALYAQKELNKIPLGKTSVQIRIAPTVPLIDYSTSMKLDEFSSRYGSENGARVEIIGLSTMRTKSKVPCGMRFGQRSAWCAE